MQKKIPKSNRKIGKSYRRQKIKRLRKKHRMMLRGNKNRGNA